MRTLPFLAILGVVAGGAELAAQDPAGSAFQEAAGRFGPAMYGLILPLGLGQLLWVAWRRRDLMGGYRNPVWLLGDGVPALAGHPLSGVQRGPGAA